MFTPLPIKNLTDALANVAPIMAKLQLGVKHGEIPYDIAPLVTGAAQKLSSLRYQNKSVSDYLNEQQLIDEDAPEMKEILKYFDANKNSKPKLSRFLKELANEVAAQGKSQGEGLNFGAEYEKEIKPLSEIIQSAKEKAGVVENKKAADKGEDDATKQKGTKILDRSASLSSASNNEPAQNGEVSEEVGTKPLSATAKPKVPQGESEFQSPVENDTLLETHPTNESAETATAPNEPKINNESGVNSRSGYSEENVSSGNTTQSEDKANVEKRALDTLKAAGLKGKKARERYTTEIIDSDRFLTGRSIRNGAVEILPVEREYVPDKLREKFNAVSKELNGEDRGGQYPIFDFRSAEDARVFKRALEIYAPQSEETDLDFKEIEEGRIREILGESAEDIAEEKTKAAVKVTGDEFGEYADIKELREKAIKYYRENLQGTSVENKALGKIDIDENGIIEFTTSGRKKLQSSSRDEEKLLLIKHLPELLSTASNIRNVESYKEKHEQDSFIYMDNNAEINSEIFPIHITLTKRNNGSIQFYNHNVLENQKRAGNSARPESSDEALGTLPFSASSTEKSQMSDATSPEPNVQNESENNSTENITQPAEKEKAEKSFETEFLKGNPKVVVVKKVDAEKSFKEIDRETFILRLDYNGKYEGKKNDDNEIHYSFESEEDAKNFKNTLDDFLIGKKEIYTDDEVRKRANEVLKENGLKNKISSEEFYISYDDKNQNRDFIIVGALYGEGKNISQKVRANIGNLAIMCHGEKTDFKDGDLFGFESEKDAKVFQMALKKYSGENELIIENDVVRNLTKKEKILKRIEMDASGAAAVNAFYGDDILNLEEIDKAAANGELEEKLKDLEVVTDKNGEFGKMVKKSAEESESAERQESNSVIVDEETKIKYPSELIIGKEKASEVFKKRNAFNENEKKLFDENMSKAVSVGAEEITRGQLIEKIAEGEIEESAVKLNKGEKEYLQFLKETITEPLEAIQKAGLGNVRAERNHKLTSSYVGKNGESLFKSGIMAGKKNTLADDAVAIENLSKLAETLEGKFENNAFTFNDKENSEIFTRAANMFTVNEHLKYFDDNSKEKTAKTPKECKLAEKVQSDAEKPTSKDLEEKIESLWKKFRNEVVQENGIKNYPDEVKKITEKIGDIKEFLRKTDFMPTAVEKGLITENKAYELVEKMLYGNEEEKATANQIYEDLQKARLDKEKTDYEKSVADGTYKKIIEKYPELENNFQGLFRRLEGKFSYSAKDDLDEYVKGGEEYQAKVALPLLIKKLHDKHGEEIGEIEYDDVYSMGLAMSDKNMTKKELNQLEEKRAEILKGEKFKWYNVSNEVDKIKADAQNGKISYAAAYQKVKQLLEDSGLEEGISEEEIAGNKRQEVETKNAPKTTSKAETQSAENKEDGVVRNEPNELGESGRTDGGHQVRESELREGTIEEEGEERSDKVSEGVSGHERQTLRADEGNDTGADAEGNRPVSEDGTGGASARTGTGNGERGSKSAVQPAEYVRRNYRITEDDEIGRGGLKEKFRQNIAAIKLLKQLESENRLATPDEQKVLAQFNGWGTLADAFTGKDGWQKENEELRELLTDKEYKAANSAVTNAFYTPPKITAAMWKMLEKLGFKGGRILDPSMGSGTFFGTMPAEIASRSELRGIELDDLTGRIAKKLYPKAAIDIKGFQEVHPANNCFDVVISNVPFEDVRPYDKEYEKQNYKLHNYFFAKAIDKVRPGGFVVFITSSGTMQSQSAESKKLRAELTQKADLIAAYKLPNTTFDKNSNTQVTTDVIILQKKLEGGKHAEYQGIECYWKWQEILPEPETGLPVNEYYIMHPSHMIGKPVEDRLTAKFGNARLGLDGKGIDVAERLSHFVEGLPENIFVPAQAHKQDALKNTLKVINNHRDAFTAYDLTFLEEDGKIYQVHRYLTPEGLLNADLVEVEKNQETIRDYLKLMKATKNIMSAQLSPETTDKKLEELRGTLHKNYDEFVKKRGYINSKKNRAILSSDPNYGQVASLENKYSYDKKTKTESAEKADIFFKRTANPIEEPTSASTAQEGLTYALVWRGRLDIDYIKKLTGKSENEIVKELGDKIYKNPETNLQELAEEYLSGNVREKLAFAIEAAKTNEEFQRNVEALEKVQPENFTKDRIIVQIGATWIAPKYYEEFVRYMIGDWRQGKVKYAPTTGKYTVTGYSYSGKNTVKWGFQHPTNSRKSRNFLQLFEALLNKKKVEIKEKVENADGSSYERLDTLSTLTANKLMQYINNEFQAWIWADETRRAELEETFNQKLNSNVERKYDGSHLGETRIPGLNEEIWESLYDHQKDSIWRIIQGGNVFLAHCVGAGKTRTMIISGMELKRLGKIQKPMYVVPANLVEQFRKDFMECYSEAKLLVLTSKDLPFVKPDVTYDEKMSARGGNEKEKKSLKEKRLSEEKRAVRRATLSRIATNDWDGIIISHSTFKTLPVSVDLIDEFYDEQLQMLQDEMENDFLDALREWEENPSGPRPQRKGFDKEQENRIHRLEVKMDRNREKDLAKETIMPFEELGIDQLFVDEAHHYKNLEIPTEMTIKGVNSNGSDQARDMYLKSRYLNKIRNGGIVFASGTPLSNTLNEAYTWQRYLGYNTLVEQGLLPFGSWAGIFGERVQTYELSAAGEGYRPIEKLNLVNTYPLRVSQSEYMDVKMEEDLSYLKRPKMKGNDYHRVIVKPTNAQLAKMKELADRHEALSNGGIDPSVDNALVITGETRATSLDMRLLDPTISETEAGNKIPAACDCIYEKYKETADRKGTQVVFLDLGTPQSQTKKKKKDTENEDDGGEVENALTENDIALYDIIKKELIKRGIPAKEIAFVHEVGSKPEDKQALFDAVNAGEIRVIIGSTPKLGEGVNIQKKLVAAHHLDCPWKPSEIKQRDGRILRAGNENEEVEIFEYITENTGDAFLREKIEHKSKMIDNYLQAKNIGDRVDAISEFTLSASQSKMLALGDTAETRKRAEVEYNLRSLKMAQAAYLQQQTAHQDDKIKLERNISNAEQKIKMLKADLAERIETKGDKFKMKIGDTVYEKRTDATAALENAIKDFTNTELTKIGEIGGFDLKARSELAYTSQSGDEKKNVNRVILQLSNHGNYTVGTGEEKNNNLIQSMEYIISKKIEKDLANTENFLAQDKGKLAEVKKKLEVPFEQQEELDAAVKKLAEIDKKMFGNGDDSEEIIVPKNEYDENDEKTAILEGEVPAEVLTKLIDVASEEFGGVYYGDGKTFTFKNEDDRNDFLEIANNEIKSATIEETDDSYAAIENKFPKITHSYDSKGKATYRLDGKKVHKDVAQETARRLRDAKTEYILNEVKEELGIIPLDYTPLENRIAFYYGVVGDIILYEQKSFETFEDAVKVARYIKENFNDVRRIEVCSGKGNTLSDFRINEDGEHIETEYAREKIEKLDAESENERKRMFAEREKEIAEKEKAQEKARSEFETEVKNAGFKFEKAENPDENLRGYTVRFSFQRHSPYGDQTQWWKFESLKEAIRFAKYLFDDRSDVVSLTDETDYGSIFVSEDNHFIFEIEDRRGRIRTSDDEVRKIYEELAAGEKPKKSTDTSSAVKAKIKELEKSTQDKDKVYQRQIDLMKEEIEKSIGAEIIPDAFYSANLPKSKSFNTFVVFGAKFINEKAPPEVWATRKPLDALTCARYLSKNYSDVIRTSKDDRIVRIHQVSNDVFAIQQNGVEEITNEFLRKCADQVLQDLRLEELKPRKNDSLGKIYGNLEDDGTITAKFDKEIEDAEKLQTVKNIAQKVGGKFNSESNTFSFDKFTDAAIFFKTVRMAFYDSKSETAGKNKKDTATAKVEIPEGYKIQFGGFSSAPHRNFIIDKDGKESFGEISAEIENATNGIVKAAPIRLQVGDEGFGFTHITLKHLQEIQSKGYPDAISYIKKILQNVNKIYSRVDTGNVDRFILCSEGAKGKSKDFIESSVNTREFIREMKCRN